MNEELYKKYVDLIFRYLMSLCHDVDLAEELTQETFFRAIQSSFKVQENCKVSSWLCQIAKHVWYHELEKRKKHAFHPLDESIVSEKDSPEETAIHTGEKMILYRKIHELKEVEKEVVLLRITGEFSFKEISEIFKKSENWARVTFYRAKQKLISSGRKENQDEV
ncbi:MAG: RNA polymerase sigma factor [Oliverpabstia sp.]